MTRSLVSQRRAKLEANALPDTWLSRAYFVCVIGLAVFLVCCILWPKRPPRTEVQANLELSLDEHSLSTESFKDLLSDAQDELLDNRHLVDLVSLAAAAYYQTRDQEIPASYATCSKWLRESVRHEVLDHNNDYLVVEIGGFGLDGQLASELVNQYSIALSERLNQSMLQERVLAQWERHRAELEDGLRYRRQWVADMEQAIERQFSSAEELGDLKFQETQAGVPASFASSTTPPPVEIDEELQELELMAADLQMREEQLADIVRIQNWSNYHPEFLARQQEIVDLRNALALRQEAHEAQTPAQPSSSRIHVEENQFYHRQLAVAELGHEVSRVRDTLQLQSEEMGQLQSEAHRWLGKEEQLNSELQQWMHEISATPSQIRVIELAKSPSLAGPVIPAGQWLGMLILSCLCAGVAAIAVARQPLTFGTTNDVAQQLGLPVLGVIPQKSRRRYVLRKLKRLQPRIQLLGEMTIAIAALILVVAVIQETRLFPMIVENPFEGVARSIQVFRGQ